MQSKEKEVTNTSLIRLLVLKHTMSDLDVEVALQKQARGGKLLLGIDVQFCGL